MNYSNFKSTGSFLANTINVERKKKKKKNQKSAFTAFNVKPPRVDPSSSSEDL